jgi:biopolymer transport protein ExbB
MPPLIAMTLVLWYMVGLRVWTLRRGTVRPLSRLVRGWRDATDARGYVTRGLIDSAVRSAVRTVGRYPEHAAVDTRAVLDDVLYPYYQQLKRGRYTISAIVVIAPLVGLLGTVSGMIETFDSLGDMSLYSQSGGIAGGISQALFSTQMGLCVAVPGVIVGRLLDRRQHQFEDELDRLKAQLGGDV